MFRDFIKRRGDAQTVWADKLGITRSYLSDLLSGKKVPSLDLAIRIQRLTDGAVPAESWIAPDAAAPTQSEDAA